MEKNEPLSYRNTMLEIEKRIPERVKIKALPESMQETFRHLCKATGRQYQYKLFNVRK